ncbi:hypothetical protein T492DRAFT_889920, partial [Pavlovales sp. CCMP2436]
AIARASQQRIGDFNPRLFDAIAHASEQRIGDFTAQGLAQIAWAFAVTGVATRGALVNAERTHLHQFFLGVELELRQPAELLTPIGLRDACKQTMADELTVSSKLHLEVSAELTRMGIAHRNELCLPKLGYHVDIAILPIADTAESVALPDDKVAVRAREALIRRHLALLGCAVVAVPYWKWDALNDNAEKAAYLAELLSSLPPLFDVKRPLSVRLRLERQ